MKKTTTKLMSELLRSRDIAEFTEQNREQFQEKKLHEYLEELLEKYQTEKKEVIKRAGMDTTYGYQIFDGRKKPKRDKIIQLAFGFPLKVEELQYMLKVGGVNALYPRVHRDAVILFCVKKKYTIEQTNDLLYEQGLELIFGERNKE